MIINGHKVYSADEFDYSTANIGDYVDAEVVMNAMDCLPPACMRLTCAQLGEPYSHVYDAHLKKWRPTYATFKCITGDFCKGVWQFCGYCFQYETITRIPFPV